MSFQKNTEKEIEAALNDPTKATAFEKHIMQCCKAPEWELRKWLKKVLVRAGFEIFEDDYKTERVSKDKRYETVHNMLAIRGEKPRVCLVAHTDVCRDHENEKYEEGEYHYWMQGRHEDSVKGKKREPLKVDPVIKVVEMEDGSYKRIVQDKNCIYQVGGDDRVGVSLASYIALNSGYPLALYFPTDEEIGLKSSRYVNFSQLKDFDLLVQIDRGNHSDELVIKIGNEILCDYETATKLLECFYDLNMPRNVVTGGHTDVYSLKSRGIVKNCCNLTCGYWNSYGSSPQEYIDIKEASDTLRAVAEIVKRYYLEE